MTPNDRCPRCGRRLTVYATRRTPDGLRVRYFACRRYGTGRKSGCGYRPADNVVVSGASTVLLGGPAIRGTMG